MKTIEQKALAYDEAIRKAKDMLSYKEVRQEDIEYLFPELKESEDERIRKELIEHIKANQETDYVLFQKFSPEDVIAWLEKQGEQKPQGKSALEAIKEKPTDNANKVASAWSYEDEANLNNIIWLCNNCIKGSETTWIPSQATKIKHLIETIKEKGLAQQNPAWSEEDERERKRIIGLLEGWLLTFKETCYAEDCECGIVWLKSLKQRIGG